MLIFILDSFTQMIKDIPRKIDVLFIDQILYEVYMVPRDLVGATFSRNHTPNKDLEQKLVRSLHVLHLSKV